MTPQPVQSEEVEPPLPSIPTPDHTKGLNGVVVVAEAKQQSPRRNLQLPSPTQQPGCTQHRPHTLTAINVQPPTPASPSTTQLIAASNKAPSQDSGGGVKNGRLVVPSGEDSPAVRPTLAMKRRVTIGLPQAPPPLSTMVKAMDTPLPVVGNGLDGFFPPLKTPLRLEEQRPAFEALVDKPVVIIAQAPVATSSDLEEVDYRLPHPSRPLEIKISGRSLYVDPRLLQDVCPLLTRFLIREVVAGHQHSMEAQNEQYGVEYGDVLEALRALCPTEMGLFPKAVTRQTFPLLVRLASKFRIPKLRLGCEQFVLRLPIRVSEVERDELLQFFNLALKYNMTSASRSRLLAGVLAFSRSHHLPTRFANSRHHDMDIEPRVYTLFSSLYPLYTHGRMAHVPGEQARLKVPCGFCRLEPVPEEPVVPTAGTGGVSGGHGQRRSAQGLVLSFKVCQQCRETVCVECAARMPCSRVVESVLAKLGGK